MLIVTMQRFTAAILCVSFCGFARAQQVAKSMTLHGAVEVAGDSDSDNYPTASLAPAMNSKDIQKAIRLVADWQVHAADGKFNQDWTYAPLYLGLLAASRATADPKYHEVVLAVSQQFDWKLWASRNLHADDEAIAQAYEKLDSENKFPKHIADARATFDRLVAYKDVSDKDLWWWCDALFMAPAGLAQMSALTGDRSYIIAMDREWSRTQDHLYDSKERLFYRDATFFGQRESNGEHVFWTRGNGWVLAGTINVLDSMAKDDPLRPKYEALFKDMAARVAELQQADGLWRPSLLDPQHYPLPEISGSAFFTYGIAWGVNHGLLDRRTFGPVIERAWAGMLRHVYADGRLGCIQPIGAAPGAFTESSSYVYGVGAFLMTGEQMMHYADQRDSAR